MSEAVRWRVVRAGRSVELIEVKRWAGVPSETDRWRFARENRAGPMMES
jgi:hypothetical protein